MATTTTTTPEYRNVLPAGWSCADFATVDLGWEEALGYWLVNERPEEMDADNDGLPCEHTEFPLDPNPCCGEEPVYSWVPGHFLVDRGVESGMYCRDLAAEYHHPDYGFALYYWLWDGEPARMDADGDGIPCETVYPERFVRDILEDPSLITTDPWHMTTDDLPTGMLCREAIWWRPFYPQVLAYFYTEGFPSRMDADDNGVPCETVYDEATESADWIRDGMPAGLTCEELAEDWGSYQEVVMYWLIHGRPDDLDPDGDGYPCSPGWIWPSQVDYFKEGMPSCCAG